VPRTQVVQRAASSNNASKAYGNDYMKTTTTDWDAWGRDQDLSVDESYGNTGAKSYRAESYDEWDNKDNDTHGAQAWGKDRDAYGMSSQEYDASADDYASKGQAYGGHSHGSYGHGHSHGGKGGWGGHGAQGYGHGSYGKSYHGSAQAGQQTAGASW
jgi:hypothetical protein